MNIDDLSISDLKAARDFLLSEMAKMEHTAGIQDVFPGKIPGYKQAKELEEKLHKELLEKMSAITFMK